MVEFYYGSKVLFENMNVNCIPSNWPSRISWQISSFEAPMFSTSVLSSATFCLAQFLSLFRILRRVCFDVSSYDTGG